MSVVYAIRWRLAYLDGRQIDELPQGSPVVDRWPDPVELHLTDMTGKAVMGIAIPPGHKPIFYRQRSIEQSANGAFGAPELDATIFGYGRENGSKVGGKLWMWRNGQAVDCPPEHIAQCAIETQCATEV